MSLLGTIQALKRLCTRELIDLFGDYRPQSNMVAVFCEEAAPFHPFSQNQLHSLCLTLFSSSGALQRRMGRCT